MCRGDNGRARNPRVREYDEQGPDPLLRNYPAGNPRSGIACWIGFHVVGIGVDNDGRALRLKKRVRPITQRDAHDDQFDLRLALGVHGEVLQITCVVPLRILPPVLLAFRIEVATGALEVWRIALAHRVDVEAMHASGKV